MARFKGAMMKTTYALVQHVMLHGFGEGCKSRNRGGGRGSALTMNTSGYTHQKGNGKASSGNSQIFALTLLHPRRAGRHVSAFRPVYLSLFPFRCVMR